MEFINCKAIAEKWKSEIKATGVNACLYVISAGDDPASAAYIKGKLKDAEDIGFKCVHKHIEADNRDQLLMNLTRLLNELQYSISVDGVIVQLPLPFGVTFDDIKLWMANEKDVDGFLADSPFDPCTPDGIVQMLKEINVDIDGKLCVIAGRSNIVGKPLAEMMTRENATVVLCHSHTPAALLDQLARDADIFISAVGQKDFIDSSKFKDGAVVIDVGINRTEHGICGDITINPNSNNILITPVPGGVGLLTRAMLMKHLLVAYQKYHTWRQTR